MLWDQDLGALGPGFRYSVTSFVTSFLCFGIRFFVFGVLGLVLVGPFGPAEVQLFHHVLLLTCKKVLGPEMASGPWQDSEGLT